METIDTIATIETIASIETIATIKKKKKDENNAIG